jgi:hypothetical protein
MAIIETRYMDLIVIEGAGMLCYVMIATLDMGTHRVLFRLVFGCEIRDDSLIWILAYRPSCTCISCIDFNQEHAERSGFVSHKQPEAGVAYGHA